MLTRRHFLRASALTTLGALTFPAGSLAGEGFQAVPMKSASGKAKFNLGIASYSFRKFDLKQVVAWTKQLGITSLSLKDFHLSLQATDEECAAVAAECKKSGVNLVGCGTVTFTKPEDIDNAIRYAEACGMKTIVCSINKPELAGELLKYLDAKIKTSKVVAAIHNHGPGDKVFPTAVAIYEQIKELDKRIGFCIDIGHTVRYGADVYADLKVCPERLYDIHMKDITSPDKAGQSCVLGKGVLDIRKILETLIEVGYCGNLSFEYESHADAPFPYVAECTGYANGMIAMM